MDNPYLPVLISVTLATVFSFAFAHMSLIFGNSKPEPEKLDVYECGMPPQGDARHRISVKFYMVAILFILFDIEAVFLFPWAVNLREFVAAGNGVFVFVEMIVFLGLLFLGWLYVLKRGALKWE